ncbi:DUF2933 domain-containing protein [Candidatus Woesearchaeota archaeon]|nr:DUF2933 domain-containing protein [Candidatus Woesearchaeota archaeon]
MACDKHKSWLMMVCCLLPIAIVMGATIFGVKNQYLTWLAFLACPMAMIFMMHMNKEESEKCH